GGGVLSCPEYFVPPSAEKSAKSPLFIRRSVLSTWSAPTEICFFQLHEAFQAQYEEIFEAIDEIAERVRALDCYSAGGLKTLAAMRKVQEGPSAAACSAKDFVSSIVLAHEQVMEGLLEVRKVAGEAGDAETEDLLIGRIKSHQKAVWFLKSYLK
ncbi:MAG: DNA starvation/stationary phase protection protein, partial [Verrucomicrobiota bacterium]